MNSPRKDTLQVIDKRTLEVVKSLTPAPGKTGSRQSADLAKTVFDRLAALFGLILLAPMLLMVAGLIWLRDPGPVLFGHLRMGRGCAPFRCLKFRTMVRNGDEVVDIAAIDEALAKQPDVLEKIREGKVQAAGAVIGAVMQAMRGQVDAARVRELILERAK